VRSIPEQTSNDEGSAQDLQIESEWRRTPRTIGREESAFLSYERSGQGRRDWTFYVASSRVKVKEILREGPAKELPMKFTTRFAIFALAFALFAIGAAVFSSQVGAQDEGWQIVRADYGFRNQRNNVTDILKDLVGRGGVNGRVAVNNQTMGGDPAVGKNKSLRIVARNRRNEEREFNFNEGGFVDVAMFQVRRDRDDWDDRGGNYGDRDRDDWHGVHIIRAYYGIQGRTINVTDLLRSRARSGGLNFVVTNSAFGGDPAVGADKYLIVIYRYQGNEAAAFVREGNTLTIP
jgi:hypothetical protein